MTMNATLLVTAAMARVDSELLNNYDGEAEQKADVRAQIEKLVKIVAEETVAHIKANAQVTTTVAVGIPVTCAPYSGATTGPGTGTGVPGSIT